MQRFELEELERATDNFSSSRLVGRGSHGSVYRGLLDNGTPAAIKTQSPALTSLRDHTKIDNEAAILSSLPADDPHLVGFLGTSVDPLSNTILVTRYMPNGTLHDLLHSSPDPPSWEKRAEIALRVARGLRTLHEAGVAHRDIKPANILFDGAWGARLADFGLASGAPAGGPALPAGTIGYMDPAYTSPGGLTRKVDVYSYGVVLMELISGRRAMDMGRSPPSVAEWAPPLIGRGRIGEVCDGRVRVPAHMGRAVGRMLRLAARCVAKREGDRPEMSEVVGELEGLTVGMVHRPVGPTNSLRGVIVKMMGLKKCRVDNGRDGKSGGVKKGTLLVREILADITFK
ncbi:Serine/threonine-protein kinase-like protein [Striga hermonthica]|uniref:Serine/threonine-protein kinase-like protein n=1 Tax=Striga hermonthica TaxID=68872 RepID=A0A9N7MSR2_STRHE|nr:Serine/threonine-protein kinase-like protein [Striga hermonthica]